MKKKKNYDITHKPMRVLAGDWLILQEISWRTGVSMAEALHRLIAHQAQLPLLDMAVKPMPVAGVFSVPVAAGVASVPVVVELPPINPIIKLRATVAKGGTNGKAK